MICRPFFCVLFWRASLCCDSLGCRHQHQRVASHSCFACVAAVAAAAAALFFSSFFSCFVFVRKLVLLCYFFLSYLFRLKTFFFPLVVRLQLSDISSWRPVAACFARMLPSVRPLVSLPGSTRSIDLFGWWTEGNTHMRCTHNTTTQSLVSSPNMRMR